MASNALQRLRRDIGLDMDDTTSLPDVDAQDILDEAEETYDAGTTAATAYARVLAIRGILASSAKLVSYKQNSTTENASDVFTHLSKLLEFWLAETDKALVSGGAAVTAFFTTVPGQRGR